MSTIIEILRREPARLGGVFVAVLLLALNQLGWIELGAGEMSAIVGSLLFAVEGIRSQVTPVSKLKD